MDNKEYMFIRWNIEPIPCHGQLHVSGKISIECHGISLYHTLKRELLLKTTGLNITEIQLIKPRFGFVPAY
jgi:hypothetical protein